MQLVVERHEPVQPQEKPRSSDKRYPTLDWQVIEDGHHGVYGLSDSLKKNLNKRVQLTGVVYDMCGQGLYLRSKDDSAANCLMPDKPTHIELLDRKRQPLKLLPAK